MHSLEETEENHGNHQLGMTRKRIRTRVFAFGADLKSSTSISI